MEKLFLFTAWHDHDALTAARVSGAGLHAIRRKHMSIATLCNNAAPRGNEQAITLALVDIPRIRRPASSTGRSRQDAEQLASSERHG